MGETPPGGRGGGDRRCRNGVTAFQQAIEARRVNRLHVFTTLRARCRRGGGKGTVALCMAAAIIVNPPLFRSDFEQTEGVEGGRGGGVVTE